MRSRDRDEEKDQAPRKREQYEPPAIVETAQFETLALACGKAGDITLDCILTPGQS